MDHANDTLRWIPLLPLLAAAVSALWLVFASRNMPRVAVIVLGCGAPIASFLISVRQVFALTQMQQACDFIAGLDPSQFDAKGHQMSMQNACAGIVRFLQQGNVAQAKRHLESLIERTDGVALRGAVDPKGAGQPHAADFIVDPQAQGPLYTLLTDALSVLP